MIDLLFGAKLWLTFNLLRLHLGHVLKLIRFWYTKYYTYLHINVEECVVSHYFSWGFLLLLNPFLLLELHLDVMTKNVMAIHSNGYSIFICIHVFWVYLFTFKYPTNMKSNTRMCIYV